MENFRQAVGNPKSRNLMGYFCPKNTFIQLEHYLLKIYLTLLSLTCVKIHQITCHFWNHIEVIFHDTVPLHLLAQTLHVFYKSSPPKCKFSDFPLLGLKAKVHQVSHVIFQTKSKFFSKVWILFQCHKRSFFCTFLAETLYAIEKSTSSKCKLSELPLVTLKFTKFLMSFLEPSVSFSSNLGHSSVSWKITLLYFLI